MYQIFGPILRLLPAEFAHALGLAALKLPIRWADAVHDPFIWHGLTFRNRVGIAAGFDKNATALRGLERMGVGFVEVGTVLIEPWPGNPKPRLKRIRSRQAIWNRLGFPSDGVQVIAKRLAEFPSAQRFGMLVGCNIGPHPGHLKGAENFDAYLGIVHVELQHLIRQLHAHADFFVVNLSSPNTLGLRGLLHDGRLAANLFAPLKETVAQLDKVAQRSHPTPLIVKLPPEDAENRAWSSETLEPIVHPLVREKACDGFVAVNTSIKLTKEMLGSDGGGISGQPLLPLAVDAIKLLRGLVGSEMLIIGCGGICRPSDTTPLLSAGCQLVEMYSGMIYRGPAFPAECAAATSRPHGELQ
jgi:dihydroorotate dehydrogenase